MKFIDTIKKRMKNIINDSSSSGGINLSSFKDVFLGDYSSDIGEISYFICMKTLSESLGKMPMYLEDSDKNKVPKADFNSVLGLSPNPQMTIAEFFTYLEYCRNHYGNAYAYCEWDANGNLKGLYPLNPRCVVIYVNNTDKFTTRRFYYQYQDNKTGKTYMIAPDDMIHVKSWLKDDSGYSGKSAREILASNMTGNKASQKFLNDLYENGLTANMVVKYVGDMAPESKKKVIDQMISLTSEKQKRVLPIPVGWDIQPLDLKLTDSQFMELKKYSALQISACFGVKPNYLNDYEKSSYANSASQNLSFYVDTLLYNLTIYEQEFSRKLLTRSEIQKGLNLKFNFSVILRGDTSTQADILNKYVTGSIYTIDEARRKAGLPPVPNQEGNVILVNGSYVPLSKAGTAYDN